jgi:predicted dehydrogenase
MGQRRARTVFDNAKTQLVGVADTNEQIAEKLADDLETVVFPNLDAILSADDVDVVVVCTPNESHALYGISALQAGKHVFCEKPLARRPAEAAEMVKTASVAHRSLKVGSNLRFFPNVKKACAIVAAGDIGIIKIIRGWIGHGGWQLFSDSWFANRDLAGGGTILDNGTHLFDLVRLLAGDARSCIGEVSTSHWPISVEDNGFGLFRLDGGGIASIHASWTQWAEYMQLEIIGDEGALFVDNRLPATNVEIRTKRGQREIFDFADVACDTYAEELEAYLSALDGPEQPVPTGLDGLRTVEMAHAVYDSARQGKRVRIVNTQIDTSPHPDSIK